MKAVNRCFILLILVLLSCNKNKENIVDDSEIRYRYFNLENAGWKSKQHMQKVDDIAFTATEVPIQYYILKDMGSENFFDADSVYQANKRERIIEFEFKQDAEKDLLLEEFTQLDYKEGVKYMSFYMEKDFYVVTSKQDTIQCLGMTFERTFKVGPSSKLLLLFADIEPEEKIQLVYNDRLFRKGTLKFKFKENITNLIL